MYKENWNRGNLQDGSRKRREDKSGKNPQAVGRKNPGAPIEGLTAQGENSA